MVQYRGQLMPLVRLAAHLGNGGYGYGEPSAEPLQVLVYLADGLSVGLVVDRILDIVEEDVSVRRDLDTSGAVLYSGVIGRRVTDLLDIDEVIRSAGAAFLRSTHSLTDARR